MSSMHSNLRCFERSTGSPLMLLLRSISSPVKRSSSRALRYSCSKMPTAVWLAAQSKKMRHTGMARSTLRTRAEGHKMSGPTHPLLGSPQFLRVTLCTKLFGPPVTVAFIRALREFICRSDTGCSRQITIVRQESARCELDTAQLGPRKNLAPHQILLWHNHMHYDDKHNDRLVWCTASHCLGYLSKWR
jgi:hypothetical protein